MLNKKELSVFGITVLILGFTLALTDLRNLFLISLIYIFIIILVNIVFKKVAAFYWDTEIEIKHWEIERYGIKPHHHFRKPLQIGLIIPIILKILTLGWLNWTAALTFEVKGKTYRAARRHGIYSFSEVSEAQIGYIAAIGILGTLLGGLLGYLLGFEEFAKLSIGYAFFNMIPISILDGNKIFFGNLTLWNFLAIIVLLGVLAIMFIV